MTRKDEVFSTSKKNIKAADGKIVQLSSRMRNLLLKLNRLVQENSYSKDFKKRVARQCGFVDKVQ